MTTKPLWTAAEVAAATAGTASVDFAVDGVAFDSREVGPGDLFIALTGESTDGHRFLDQAFAQGAAGAIVVADLTRAASFDAAVRVIEQIRGDEIGCNIPIALAANKSDLPSRQVEAAAVQAVQTDLKLADARETSCKTGDGVLALARALVRALPPPEAPPETVELEGPSSSTACC